LIAWSGARTRASSFTLALCFLPALACSEDGTRAAASVSGQVSELPAQELMIHVIEPAARNFWKGWGEVLDENGWRDVSPRNDGEWKVVEDGAATLLAASEPLRQPAYGREPVDKWERLIEPMLAAARDGKAGAEKQDSSLMFALGEKLDEACDACHAQFAPHVP